MTEVPHLLVRVTVETSRGTQTGISADSLIPKWFTKNPATSFEDADLPEMLAVIRNAADIAIGLNQQHDVFSWWRELYHGQQQWAQERTIPPLLAGFGVSLMERAVIDACCRDWQTTLFAALRDNRFGVRLDQVRPSTAGLKLADVLPRRPRRDVFLRHTIGLADPLSGADIPADEVVDDGLPHSLIDNIRRYQLSHFKIKLGGDLQVDRERLGEVAAIIKQQAERPVKVTLDANEHYRSIAAFREHWSHWNESADIRQLLEQSLLFVEQPLHRDCAFSDQVAPELNRWPTAPPIIIDESDGDLDSFPRAIDFGYAGTSHKNCKGVFKGLINAATMHARRLHGHRGILSAEDLVNVGPVALLQDLAVVAAFGINHVERNGHHYFAGLSAFGDPIQRQMIELHSDLYRMTEQGWATLAPRHGRLALSTVNRAPFGVAVMPNAALTEPWDL